MDTPDAPRDPSASNSTSSQLLPVQQTSSSTPAPAPRPARSKNGCLTCRRRKVRCDEQRPRCFHCERLNLQCRWRPPYAASANQWRMADADPSHAQRQTPAQPQCSPGTTSQGSPETIAWPQNPGAVDQLFDYASFMWDAGGEIPGQGSSPDERTQFGNLAQGGHGWLDPYSGMTNQHPFAAISADASLYATTDARTRLPTRGRESGSGASQGHGQLPFGGPSRPGLPPDPTLPPSHAIDDHHLISYFVRTVVPPILAEVETQKRWSSMRQMLVSMSNSSPMVRNAILAFSLLLYCRQEPASVLQPCPPHHYENASSELATAGDLAAVVSHTPLREHLLATLFFLSYVDILEDRIDSALKHLERAYQIFQQGNKRGFRPVEIRLLSWLRILDARTASAGGEGLFLSDNSEALLVSPSPASVAAEQAAPSEGTAGAGGADARDEVKEWDIEDVLFQVLYQPGIVFFQKVQSFMGRISRIDPWHRSRGTVEDEMEVMQIASRILADLRGLYDDRPTLMDHAVQGHLSAPHVSPQLAVAITRAFRTYLSNYHASKVHLHRVAYKHLPLTRDTTEALGQIRHLTRLMVDSLEQPDAALPVSQLWPLLMLGSEEQDPEERGWIRRQILRMEKVATNASVTAQVLEEVQVRQDSSKSRVDIRAVMHAVFDSCFAIM